MKLKEIAIKYLSVESRDRHIPLERFDPGYVKAVKKRYESGKPTTIVTDNIGTYVYHGYKETLVLTLLGIEKARVWHADVWPGQRRVYEAILSLVEEKTWIQRCNLGIKILNKFKTDDRDVMYYDDDMLKDLLWLRAYKYITRDNLIEREIKIQEQEKIIKGSGIYLKDILEMFNVKTVKFIRPCRIGHRTILINKLTDNLMQGSIEKEYEDELVKVKSISILPEKEEIYKAFVKEYPCELTNRVFELLVYAVIEFPYDDGELLPFGEEYLNKRVQEFIEGRVGPYK